jgi:hypothetical protein
MKTKPWISAAMLVSSSLLAATATPKDDVLNAAKKLGDQPNYAWKTTIVVPEQAPFKPGPTEGKTEKDGLICVTMSFGDNKLQAAVKGDKGAAMNQEGKWQSLAELEQEQGPGQFVAMIVRNLKVPAKEAGDIAGFAKDLKKEGDAYASDLTEDGAKALQRFGGRGGDGPTVSNASGSARFWLKDGALTKYEFKLKGTINFNGNEFPNERTTTVEIKDVGTTKTDLPDDARKKLS